MTKDERLNQEDRYWDYDLCGCGNRKLKRSKVCQDCYVPWTKGIHGLRRSSAYGVWSSMRQRCLNPAADNFPLYGGRGISVCERWNSFENFLADMGERPSRKHSIGRIDNDGNYEPGNCRWETNTEQANNKRTTVLIELNGVTKSMAMWARELGISRGTLKTRIFRGWSPERALTQPIEVHRR